MILIDTSVWIHHLRKSTPQLQRLLLEEQVMCHPFVIGEVACGNLKNRGEILSLMRALPKAEVAEHEEVLRFINNKSLFGVGIGLIDVHLLASTFLSKSKILTEDKKLQRIASKLGVLYKQA